ELLSQLRGLPRSRGCAIEKLLPLCRYECSDARFMLAPREQFGKRDLTRIGELGLVTGHSGPELIEQVIVDVEICSSLRSVEAEKELPTGDVVPVLYSDFRYNASGGMLDFLGTCLDDEGAGS